MPEVSIALPKFHEKQQQVFDSPATEILFAGDTRAGKSYFIRRAYIIWCSQIPGLQTDIFRLHYDDVIAENMQGETGFRVLLREWEQSGLCKITESEVVFWNTSRISLEHCGDDVVMMKHQGIAKHVRTFAESCQMLEHRIRALTGWVTMSEEMKSRVPDKWKGQFPKVFHVTNPKGISSGYYRRHFVDCRAPYSIEPVGQFMRQYIPAFLDDNPSENAEATRQRIAEAFPDETTQFSLINQDKSGITNWHTGTGEFFPEWNEARHVVTDFWPPTWWFRFRALDLGYAEPACVLWCAVSDGEPFKTRETRADGTEYMAERWFPRGAFVIYQEWYICDPKDPSKGLRMRNEDIRDGIIARCEEGHRHDVTLTDMLPFQDRGGESVPAVFANKGAGITLTLGDTSRVVGWNQMRSRLIGVKLHSDSQERTPMIYFCENCKYTRDYIPALPRHKSEGKKEDAAEHGEATHAPDCVRLICMAHTIIKDKVEPLQSRIERELASKKRNIKTITREAGYGYFK